jgi:hypothetical protein
MIYRRCRRPPIATMSTSLSVVTCKFSLTHQIATSSGRNCGRSLKWGNGFHTSNVTVQSSNSFFTLADRKSNRRNTGGAAGTAWRKLKLLLLGWPRFHQPIHPRERLCCFTDITTTKIFYIPPVSIKYRAVDDVCCQISDDVLCQLLPSARQIKSAWSNSNLAQANGVE